MDGENQGTLLLGTCTYDPGRLTLRDASGATLHLRSQSLRVLSALAQARGQVLSRDFLVDSIWPGIAVTDDSLVQCIKDIRSALSDADRQIVKTVVGQGYVLSARTAAEAAASPPKICVELFRVSGGSAEAAELADALFEELVIRLTPRAGMSVITDPARRGEASYVISGRVSVRSGQARIFLQIARSGRGEDIHAATEEASGEDIWGLPGRVADTIASRLRVLMIAGDGSELVSRDDAGLSPQQLMAKAAWHLCRFRRENWHAARASLEAAVKIAPENPVALAMLASWDTQMIPLIPFDELPADVDRAMDLSQRAVEHGQSIDYVLRTRGNLRLWRLGDHDGARLDCERALQINPIFHLAHLTIATSEIFSGELSAGTLRLEEMMRRAPADLQNPLYFSLIALANLLAGKKDMALAAAREGFERNPLGSWNALVLAAVAADDASLTQEREFRRMVGKIDLPARHYLDLPFTDRLHGVDLAARAAAAGVGGASD